MMRNWWKFFYGLNAMAILAMAGMTALAGDLGVVRNGDIELESRFAPHGTPGVDHPNGYPDAWHHSGAAAWSGVVGGPMFVSPTHSLYIPDDNTSVDGDEEHRAFATPLPPGGSPTLKKLDLSWLWKWDITSAPTDQFSALIRIAKNPVSGLDLDVSGGVTEYLVLTPGPSSGGAFLPAGISVPLAPDDRSFDIIFASSANGPMPRLETGVMWVDDVSGIVPEPATMGLLGLAGLGLMMVSRRRRG